MSESSESSDSFERNYNSDVILHQCVQCNRLRSLLKTSECTNCGEQICEDCGLVGIGCAYAADDICKKCFQTLYKSKQQYCREPDCTCGHKSEAGKLKLARQKEAVAKFKASCDEEFKKSWRQTHRRIDYPDLRQGRFLIDLFLSSEDMDQQHIEWLLYPGRKNCRFTAANPSVNLFIAEAKELRALSRRTRVQPRREASPRRGK